MKCIRTFSNFVIKSTVYILIVFTLVSSCFAASADVYASRYITSYDKYIWRNSDGSIGVEFDVTATGTMSQIGAAKLLIQRKNGDKWETVKTYSSDSTPVLIAQNTYYHTAAVKYSGASISYTYRAQILIYVENASGTDSRLVTTSSI